jgi:hypothetical protein
MTLLRNARSIFDAYTSNNVVCNKEVPFGDLIDAKKISTSPTLQMAIACKSKKWNNF